MGRLLSIYQNNISIAKAAEDCDYYVTGIDLDCWTRLGWEQRLKHEPGKFKCIWAQIDLRKPRDETHNQSIVEHLKPRVVHTTRKTTFERRRN